MKAILPRRGVLTLSILLAAALMAQADSSEAGKKKKKKQAQEKAQAAETASGGAASKAPSPARPDPLLRDVEKRILAYDVEKARQLLEPAIDVQNARHRAARGRILTLEGKYDQAEGEFKAASERDAADPAPWVFLGEARLWADRQGAADEAFRAAAERARARASKDPQDAEAHYFLGVAQQRLRAFDDAFASLDKARQLEPNNPLPLYQQGLTRAFQQRWEEAVDLLGRAIEMDSGIAYAYYYRGLAADKLGRKSLLVNDLDRFLFLAPNAPEADRARKLLAAAQG